MTAQEVGKQVLLCLWGFFTIPTIAVFYGKHIIRTDMGRKRRNTVTRLCHIVETCIVHDRGGSGIHTIRKCFGTQRICRKSPGSNHIVTQSQRVSHLMACHKTHGITHQFIRQPCSSCFGTYDTGLHCNPFLEHAQHIMPPHDVRFQYLARTGVEDRGAHGIGFGGGGVGQHGVVHVILIHIHAVRQFLGYDSILESGTFKSSLPILDSLLDIFPPTTGSGVLDVEHNRLGRFHQFTAKVTLPVFRFRFQTPAGDEGFLVYTLLTVTVIQQRIGKVTYARTIQTSHHRFLRQQQQRGTDFDRNKHSRCSLGHLSCQLGSGYHIVLKSFDR